MALIICQRVTGFFQLHVMAAVITGIENIHMIIFLNGDVYCIRLMFLVDIIIAIIYRRIPSIINVVFISFLLNLQKVLLIPKLRVLIAKCVLNSFLLSKFLKMLNCENSENEK